MKRNLHKHFGISFLILFIVALFYPVAENAFAQTSPDTDVVLVTLDVTAGITISAPTDIALSALTISQNTAVGSAVWTVITNNAAGYNLTVYAGAPVAMVRTGGGGDIVDYTTAVADTPETWSVSSAAEFGFSADGADVIAAFTPLGDTDCIAAANVPSATLKWRDFSVVGTPTQIATSATKTSTSGTATTMCVAVEQNGVFASSGTYTATITATATTL